MNNKISLIFKTMHAMKHIIILLVTFFCFSIVQAQSIKELEKTHKEIMKELKQSQGLKRVEVCQDPDGTYYLQLTSKGKLMGRADMDGRIIFPAKYSMIEKCRLDKELEVYKIKDLGNTYGIADLNGKIIVPTEFSEINYYPPLSEGRTYYYPPKQEETNSPFSLFVPYASANAETCDSIAIFHDSEPPVFYAQGKLSKIYSVDGHILCDSIKSDKYVCIPGYFIIGAEYPSSIFVGTSDINVTFHSYVNCKCGIISQSGKIILPLIANNITFNAPRIYGKSFSGYTGHSDTFISKYKKPRNWCEYSISEGNDTKHGGFIMGFQDEGIPPIFYSISYYEFGDKWKVQKSSVSNYEIYQPAMGKEAAYRDKGEEYYEKKEYDNVINFYATEGVDKPWAKFFTAMSLYNKAYSNISNMKSVILIIKKHYENLTSIEKYPFDIQLATEQYKTALELFNAYIQEDSIYNFYTKIYLTTIPQELEKIPEEVERYNKAIQTLQQRQAAELQRQQEIQQQKNAMWANILSRFLKGAANTLLNKSNSSSSSHSTATYSGGETSIGTTSSGSSSSNNSSKIAEWENKKADALRRRGNYEDKLRKEPNSSYYKQMVRDMNDMIKLCDDQIQFLRTH